jgi:hypothetical protein
MNAFVHRFPRLESIKNTIRREFHRVQRRRSVSDYVYVHGHLYDVPHGICLLFQEVEYLNALWQGYTAQLQLGLPDTTLVEYTAAQVCATCFCDFVPCLIRFNISNPVYVRSVMLHMQSWLAGLATLVHSQSSMA